MSSNPVRTMLETAIIPQTINPSSELITASQMLSQLLIKIGHDPTMISTTNLQEIAERLSKIANQEPAWGWRYLRNILNGKLKASRVATQAIMALGSILDGIPADLAAAHPVSVMVLGDVTPGALVLASSRPCANPYCMIHFVPSSPRQRYHSAACRRADYKRRKAAAA